MSDSNKPVTVMIGNYPYETREKDVPKVLEMARKAAEHLLSLGAPKEKVEKLYTTRVIRDLD